MKNRSLILGLALAALSPIAAGAHAIMAESQVIQANRKRSTRQTSGSYWTGLPGRKGPGWSAAHVKRMAVKSRNQRRHKAACKGGAA